VLPAGGTGSAAAGAKPSAGTGKSSFQFVGVITQFKESLGFLMDSIGATQVGDTLACEAKWFGINLSAMVHHCCCLAPLCAVHQAEFGTAAGLLRKTSGSESAALRWRNGGSAHLFCWLSLTYLIRKILRTVRPCTQPQFWLKSMKPNTFKFNSAWRRYKILVKHTPGQDYRESCVILFEALHIPAIERQFGSTKLFLKSGMVIVPSNIWNMRSAGLILTLPVSWLIDRTFGETTYSPSTLGCSCLPKQLEAYCRAETVHTHSAPCNSHPSS